ncbi:MAG: N-acetylmuramoyl-L-alanine amidase [Treponema sp.]|nr:N-acetylmuramoyl-L-alanine amidase [Treponema sp.]
MTKIGIFKFFFLCSLFFVLCSLLPALTLDETLDSIQSISPNNTMQFQWDALFRSGIIKFGNHYGSFLVSAKEGETGYLIINNQELYNVPLPYNNEGLLVFPDSFVSTLKDTFTRLHENDTSRFRISTIVIDPGHGGRDPGAVGYINGKNNPLFEKDIVLKVGLALRDRLIQTYPDKRIMMTRDNDIFISLEQRADIANAVTVRDNEAVIFISIHANWGANQNARGYEVWHITSGNRRRLLDTSKHNYSSDINAILNAMLEEEFTTESILLANSILQGFDNIFGKTVPSRGRKANDWFVVKNSRMPAVLVELGFVTNRQDTVLMSTEDGLQKLTNALYNGVTDFVGIFER